MLFVIEVDNDGFKVYDSTGNLIDPAKDQSVQSVLTALNAIKNTDGIKKITDQLPAGTNEIGKVAQGTRATAAGGWPEYLVDADGHVVGVLLDGSIYRLQVDGKIAKGMTSAELVHLDALDTTSGRGRLKTTVYTPDGDPVAFGAVSKAIKNDFVKSGGSDSLLVNGATTPVVFSYDCDATYDISLQEMKFTLAANGITFGTNYFGGIAGPLTNGLLVEVISGGDTIAVYNLKQNESFVNFSSPGGFEWVVSSKDMMTSNYLVGGGLKLHHGTSDKVRVTVRDNLSAAGAYFKFFVKGFFLTSV